MSETLTPLDATGLTGVMPWSAERYFSELAYINNSSLKVFRDNPEEYHGRFISGIIPPDEPTASQRSGTLLHLRTLEPERYLDVCRLAPELGPDGNRWNRTGKDHKAAWQELMSDLPLSSQLVRFEEWQPVEQMFEGIMRNKTARGLLEQRTASEQAIVGRCEETALLMKALLDAPVRRDGPRDLILDIKTASDASDPGFKRACENYGYDGQAAFYLRLYELVFGREAEFLHIVVMNSAPWTCGVHRIDHRDIEQAAEWNQAALIDLAARKRSGDWRPEWAAGIRDLSRLSPWRNKSGLTLE